MFVYKTLHGQAATILTVLHQHHRGPAALNTSLGDTHKSHLAEIKNKVRNRSFSVAGSLDVELAACDIRTSPPLAVDISDCIFHNRLNALHLTGWEDSKTTVAIVNARNHEAVD